MTFLCQKIEKLPKNENLKKIRSKKIKKTENLGKNELAETARQRLSNANKKPSKNPKKTLRRPRRHFYEFWLLNATKWGARAPPLSLRISHSQSPQKCLRGRFFEGFRGPREDFLR